jgi:signal transduction histidine kinase
MLKNELSEDRRERLLGCLIANADLLDRLSRDLSLLLAADREPFDVQLESVDVARLVREVASRLVAASSIAEPSIHAGPGRLVGRVDAQRIEQVLVNVLRNASQYGVLGAPLELFVARSGDAIRVDVVNAGRGPTPDERARLFEPYVRLDPKRPGVGLGLYVSRGIVEAHGGRIWMDVEGDRTRVSFTVPSRSVRAARPPVASARPIQAVRVRHA